MHSQILEHLQSRKNILILLLVSFLVRVPLLNHAFLLRGERDIVLTGYSLLKTGRDLYGNFMPLQFFGLDQPSPMLSFYYSALGWLLFPLKNILFARMPFMIAALVGVWLVYELIFYITKHRGIALLTAGILSLSPGFYHLSMLALEINLAMPLLLGGMLLYLRGKRIWGWVLLAGSFFTYNGFRPLIPFVVLYLECFSHMQKPDLVALSKRLLLALMVSVGLIVGSFAVDGGIMTSRKADLVFLSYERITPEVVFKRNTSDAPTLMKTIIHNKATETVQYMVDVVQEGISSHYLFFRGDRAAIYTSTFGGQFFAISILAFAMGFMYLGAHPKREYLYIVGFVPVALVSSVVNIDYVSVAIRSLLASVSYAFIIAAGCVYAAERWDSVRRLWGPWVSRSIIGIILVASVIEASYFAYNYVFRRPTMMFESYFEHERQLVEYVQSADRHVTVFDSSPKNILTAYHILNPDADIRDLQKSLQGDQGSIHTPEIDVAICPASGDKAQMYEDGTLIAFACLDPDEYATLDGMPHVGRIPFEDFSLNTAYFVYKYPEAEE